MIGQAKRLYELNSLNPNNNIGKGNCKIIAFSSGKGGTGKSFLASNISFALSEKGKRVLLIDLDLNFSNLKTLFNVNANHNIYHFLTYNKSLSDVVTKYTENLHLILGESGKLDHPVFSVEKSDFLLSAIKKISLHYDYVFIDTPSGIDNGTLNLLLNSDDVVLVVTPEPTSIMDSYVILKLLKSNGAQNSLKAIVNKSFDETEANEAFENLKKAVAHFLKLDIDYLGTINFSEEIIRSVQNQSLLKQQKNFTSVSIQISEISHEFEKQTIGQ